MQVVFCLRELIPIKKSPLEVNVVYGVPEQDVLKALLVQFESLLAGWQEFAR